MAIQKKNILILTSEFPPLPGGIGNHAYNIAEYLQKLGYRVSVIADQRDTIKNEAEFDSKQQSKVYRVKLKKIRVLMYLKRVLLAFRWASKNDVLICSGKFPLWLGAFIKRFLGIETIAVIHGTEVNFSNQRLKKSIDKSLLKFDKVIAVSHYTKQLVNHLSLKAISIIPNGFSANNWETDSESTMELNGYPKLLTVGNVTERKGQLHVIKHLPEVIKQFPNVHYHCVGFKTEMDKCMALAKTLHIEKYITFHGHLSHTKLQAFYKKSDICVMLSQETATGDIEGFGIALIEANYFGLPTIGALGCGIEDAINDGVSGILVDAKKSAAFVNAIKTIEAQKSNFKTGATDWAKQHHWEIIIKKYADTIEF